MPFGNLPTGPLMPFDGLQLLNLLAAAAATQGNLGVFQSQGQAGAGFGVSPPAVGGIQPSTSDPTPTTPTSPIDSQVNPIDSQVNPIDSQDNEESINPRDILDLLFGPPSIRAAAAGRSGRRSSRRSAVGRGA